MKSASLADSQKVARVGDHRRRICFVTGTRAEFGLMRSTLLAIREHPLLKLQIVVTGMHLSARHGHSLQTIRSEGWKIDAVVPWQSGNAGENAVQTGLAMAGIAKALGRLKSDVVLVVGDRVEAFAAAAAGQVGGRIVAHVHGGDRALGQVDDSLRHAITKLAHVHFPATRLSRERILKLGEDRSRVHRVGSPGIDGIALQAGTPELEGRYALVILHPTETVAKDEFARAAVVLNCVEKIGFDRVVIVYPNNDPGSAGIIRCWETSAGDALVFRDLARSRFLALLRDAAVLVGNSSSGIIEAASFGTPVVNISDRQLGRECSGNVCHVSFARLGIRRELVRIWNGGEPIRYPKRNVYSGDGAGRRIAEVLARVRIDAGLRRKLIAY